MCQISPVKLLSKMSLCDSRVSLIKYTHKKKIYAYLSSEPLRERERGRERGCLTTSHDCTTQDATSHFGASHNDIVTSVPARLHRRWVSSPSLYFSVDFSSGRKKEGSSRSLWLVVSTIIRSLPQLDQKP
jgi:hypothetical protein